MRVPGVLSVEEVKQVIQAMSGPAQLVVKLFNLTKIHLRLHPRLHLHPRKGHRLGLAQLPHKPFDRLVAATEPMLANQVLINALGT